MTIKSLIHARVFTLQEKKYKMEYISKKNLTRMSHSVGLPLGS